LKQTKGPANDISLGGTHETNDEMSHARKDMWNKERIGIHSAFSFPHAHVSAQGPAHLRRLDVSSMWATNCSHVFKRLLSLTKHLMHFGYLK
jgi:hypothetical protein